MLRSIRSEALKVVTTRAWWILAIVLFGYIALFAGGMAALFGTISDQADALGPGSSIPPLVYSFATSVGYVFPLLFGALATTTEFRHQTLTPTFLATPRRGEVLGSKVIVGAAWGAIFGVVGIVATVGVGGLILALVGVDPLLDSTDTWALLGRMVLAMALWGVIGVGLGVLVPNQVASIVIVLAFTQFVEPTLRIAAAFWEWSAEVGRFLPGAASDALVGSSFFTSLSAGGGANLLEWWQGGLVLAGYAVVFIVSGALTTWRRDVT
ncbi:ABC transporter permease [Homoserinibacter sp. GY 40078]|uniref:ABC transporter permease n=1 Tax=Homoserinibacter sp. GY 40078 TaxID=2603275 RepID=UPI0011CAB819|nr:ABC transporter permease [Homoserinibacter sp. GY 40078]TXK17230.1 ABC transporter permease [Homoserinibacter sp. GY 40078]